MVDETRAKSNKEQLTLVLWWINKDFVVLEEFVDRYCLSKADAQLIVDVVKDTFLRFQFSFAKLCG